MPVADVVRVVEQAFAVRADVEHDGNHAHRIDPGSSGVDGKLANGNLDATDAPVADTEDFFGVGRHEQINVVGSGAVVAQRLFNAFRMVNGQVDATGSAVLKAVLLDRHAHRRIINDRQHLIHIFGQQLVKQDFVT